MNLFKTFLEIKTGKEDVKISSVFVKTSKYGTRGEYVEYYYDRAKHSFYINDTKSQVRALKYIKEVVGRAYIKELCPLFVSSRDKRPNIFQVHLDEKAWMLVINELFIDIEETGSVEVL